MVEDDRNMKVAALTLGMLREERIPPGLIRAAWCTMTQALAGRLAVAQRMLDLRVVELAVEHLSQFTPEQWVSSSAFCQNGWTGTALIAIKDVIIAKEMCPDGEFAAPAKELSLFSVEMRQLHYRMIDCWCMGRSHMCGDGSLKPLSWSAENHRSRRRRDWSRRRTLNS